MMFVAPMSPLSAPKAKPRGAAGPLPRAVPQAAPSACARTLGTWLVLLGLSAWLIWLSPAARAQSFAYNSANLTTPRASHTATLLTSGSISGKILIIGGSSGLSYLSSTELYDPAANTFTANSASLMTARYLHRQPD